MDGELALDLKEATKTYGRGRRRVEALRDVSVQVRPGEIFGLLGPNGAGKSTLVKILMTVVRPNRAAGTLLGHPIGRKATLARVGYLPEHHRFPRYLTGRQMLEFFGAMSGVERKVRKTRAAELLDLVGMTQAADRKLEGYSKGMLQRVGLAQSLMSDPQMVLLDEPTDGVDPIGRKEILTVLRHLREQGKTVFVNSHLLSELEQICDRVAIMLRGHVVRQGTLEELSSHRRWYELEFAAPDAMGLEALLLPNGGERTGDNVTGKLSDGTWCELQRGSDSSIFRIGTAEAQGVQQTLDILRGSGCVIRRVELVQPSLEDLFIEAVNEQQAPGVKQ